MTKRVFILIVISWSLQLYAWADQPKEPKNTWGIWGATSFGTAPLGGLRPADLKNRGLALIALHYGHLLRRTSKSTLYYTADVLPVIVARNNEVLQSHPGEEDSVGRQTLTGYGANPAGFQWNMTKSERWQPFAFVTAGFLIFDKPIPTPHATRANFGVEGGIGLQISLHRLQAVSVGYHLHHISNAGTGRTNPSLNTHMISVGFNIFR